MDTRANELHVDYASYRFLLGTSVYDINCDVIDITDVSEDYYDDEKSFSSLIGALVIGALCSQMRHPEYEVGPTSDDSPTAVYGDGILYRLSADAWDNQNLDCSRWEKPYDEDTTPEIPFLGAVLVAALCGRGKAGPSITGPDGLPADCGRSLETESYRALGVRLGEFPWVARVGRELRRVYEDYCGGALITDQLIVTTASCLDKAEPDNIEYKVRFGVLVPRHKRSDGSDMTVIHVYDIDKYIIHEHFDRWTMADNIALVKLKGRVPFSDYIRPICLQSESGEEVPIVGKSTVYAGWDRQEKGFIYGILKKMKPKVENTDQCQRRIQSRNVIDDRVVCAVVSKRGCINTLGGPLMSQVHGRWTLAGAASWNHGDCDRGDMTTVFTRVSSYRDWIMDHLQD